MDRFPLRRLPYVALKEVILSIDRCDVINLALSSRKTCRLINTTRNFVSMQRMSQDVIDKLGAKDRLNIVHLEYRENSENVMKSMELKISEKPSVKFILFNRHADVNSIASAARFLRILTVDLKIESIDSIISGNQEIMRFGDLDVSVIINSKNAIFTTWNDIEIGFQFLVRHFIRKLNLDEITLEADPKGTDGSKFSELLKKAVEIAKFPLKKKPKLTVEEIGRMTDDDIQIVFRNMKYSRIEIRGSLNGKLKADFACEAKNLLVYRADGFSLKNLLNSKCSSTVRIFGTQMTNRVMKKIVSHWMERRLETLGTLFVELMEAVDLEQILAVVSDRNGCVIERYEDKIVIRREDGKKASILIPAEPKFFHMIPY